MNSFNSSRAVCPSPKQKLSAADVGEDIVSKQAGSKEASLCGEDTERVDVLESLRAVLGVVGAVLEESLGDTSPVARPTAIGRCFLFTLYGPRGPRATDGLAESSPTTLPSELEADSFSAPSFLFFLYGPRVAGRSPLPVCFRLDTMSKYSVTRVRSSGGSSPLRSR